MFAEAQEKWRPKFHFTPEKNWMNDPNGLVFLDGEWHLFFQHNPSENKWGHMSWGHAVSKDMLTWQEIALAIPEGENEFIFSGSIVNDKSNSSGFFDDKNGLIAIYTADYHGKLENQHLAFSKDKGRTWTKYDQNPILAEPISHNGALGEQEDFRDPNVFWHEGSQKWIMAVVLPKLFTVQFYSSKNLKNWQWESDFGKIGDLRKMWECPGMTQIPILDIDGNEIGKKWLLMVSSNGPYEGYTGMQYFLGDFDGKSFIADNGNWPKYLDHGKDFYAAIPFNNVDKSLIMGWFNNWRYADYQPETPWKGQMSTIRELYLQESRDGVSLRQKPLIESKKWNEVLSMDTMPLASSDGIEWKTTSASFRIQLEVEIANNEPFGIHFLQKGEQKTTLTYFPASQELVLDRRASGHAVNESFLSQERSFCPLKRNKLKLDILVDQCTVEVFANEGEVVISDLVFPEEGSNSWRIFGNDDQGKVTNLKVWEWD